MLYPNLTVDNVCDCQIMTLRMGKTGALFLWSFVCLTAFFVVQTALQACSRTVYAFSRDHGLPFSGLLYNMNPRTKTPVHAVCFVALFALLLGLISFAGSVAITAVFTMSVVCQYIGFTIPIVARWVGGTKFVPGPFSLGKLVSGALAEDTLRAFGRDALRRARLSLRSY